MRHRLRLLAPLALVAVLMPALANAQKHDAPQQSLDQAPLQEPQQEQADAKFAYIAGLDPARTFYCRVMPRSSGSSETQLELDFTLEGAGPVEAKMVVTGSVNGRRYSARMNWRGTASAVGNGHNEALINLDEIYDWDGDPLPGDAEWSDPSGDTISLRIEDHYSMGTQPYILVGTQVTEFGVNDVRCLDGISR